MTSNEPTTTKKASKTLICLGVLALLALGVIAFSSTASSSRGKQIGIKLSRGMLTVLDFPSKKAQATAVILFASGDGGWGSFEEDICHAFQDQGYEVIGIDSVTYAQTDYDLDILQSDFSTIARMAQAVSSHPLPLIIGGYSMGAAQAIAAAGGPHPPDGLAGLLLLDPCSRGRYGLRSSDRMDVLPTGPGTFNIDAFSNTMGSLRIIQWHAGEDSIDSTAWLDLLTAPHKLLTFPGAGHDYAVNRENFIRQLVENTGWILDPIKADAVTVKKDSSRGSP